MLNRIFLLKPCQWPDISNGWRHWVLVLWISKCTALDLMANELLLTACQTTGGSLYAMCVAVTSLTPEQVVSCTGMKIKYTACLQQLNQPYPLIPAIDPDPYAWTPFSPCIFETGHLILPGLCPTLP